MTTEVAVAFHGGKNGTWVPTAERERFCGIHVGKSIRIFVRQGRGALSAQPADRNQEVGSQMDLSPGQQRQDRHHNGDDHQQHGERAPEQPVITCLQQVRAKLSARRMAEQPNSTCPRRARHQRTGPSTSNSPGGSTANASGNSATRSAATKQSRHKAPEGRLNLPTATGRVGTPAPARLACARRGPGPPGTGRETPASGNAEWSPSAGVDTVTSKGRADVVQPARHGVRQRQAKGGPAVHRKDDSTPAASHHPVKGV